MFCRESVIVKKEEHAVRSINLGPVKGDRYISIFLERSLVENLLIGTQIFQAPGNSRIVNSANIDGEVTSPTPEHDSQAESGKAPQHDSDLFAHGRDRQQFLC